MLFQHKNLGILSTLRIGHDTSAGTSQPSKWFMDYALIRNEITGRAYRYANMMPENLGYSPALQKDVTLFGEKSS